MWLCSNQLKYFTGKPQSSSYIIISDSVKIQVFWRMWKGKRAPKINKEYWFWVTCTWPVDVYGNQTKSMASRHIWAPNHMYCQQTYKGTKPQVLPADIYIHQTTCIASRYIWPPNYMYCQQTHMATKPHVLPADIYGHQTTCIASRHTWPPNHMYCQQITKFLHIMIFWQVRNLNCSCM